MLTAVDDLPVLEPDPAASVEEHLAAVERVRARSWIARSGRGLEVLSYDGCEAGFRNPAFLHPAHQAMRKMGVRPEDLAGQGRNLALSEGEQHARLHRVVSRWFTPRSVDGMRERVAALVDELLAPLAEAGSGDFVRQVTRRLPGPVFCWMIGASPAEGDRLYALSEILLRAFSGDPAIASEIAAAAAELRAFVEDLIALKRREPAEDLMSIMLHAADRGDLDPGDVHTLAFEMLAASTDNTSNSAALALILLCRHPDQWRVLRADPAGVAPGAVEECARVLPRVRCVSVWNPEPARLLDFEVPAESSVNLDLPAAHHDPSVYPDPRRFDVLRAHARPQLNFGAGRHYCLGAALARMELQVLLERIASAWETVALAGEPDTTADGIDAAVRSLPIAVAPARRR